jgi:hypothetical protein
VSDEFLKPGQFFEPGYEFLGPGHAEDRPASMALAAGVVCLLGAFNELAIAREEGLGASATVGQSGHAGPVILDGRLGWRAVLS